MRNVFDDFKKTKEYLVCIDSDGCAMDTMNVKHTRCFGPCLIREWNLEKWQEPIQERWNDINLYSQTRGINRFLGLAMALREIDQNYVRIENIEQLTAWVRSSGELSNKSLKREMERNPSVIFKKALSWSESVNEEINRLSEEEKIPFTGVEKVLQTIHEYADVAIVSSANQQAILEEWEKYGLLKHTDIILSQNAGSKAYCIQKLLEKGYGRNQTLMVGDAPGDRDAAGENSVLYYPILVRREKQSWNLLQEEAFEKFLNCTYGGAYQKVLLQAFEDNLK